MTSAFGVVGGEAEARESDFKKKWKFTSLASASPPMTTMHHVIPHPGFLRDAGSPEQALNIQSESFDWAELFEENPPQRLLHIQKKEITRAVTALIVTSQEN